MANTTTKTRYYTFGCEHPLAGYVQKIVTTDGSDPRDKMIAAYGTSWAAEYGPEFSNVAENEDGTVTFTSTSRFTGKTRTYTYRLLKRVL